MYAPLVASMHDHLLYLVYRVELPGVMKADTEFCVHAPLLLSFDRDQRTDVLLVILQPAAVVGQSQRLKFMPLVVLEHVA